MSIKIKRMENDDEIKGKAYVHWRSWHEAYQGLVSEEYLDKLTLEKCEKMAYSWPDNLIVAKEDDRVIGFVGFGNRGDEAPNTGEIFALYVLKEYYGKGVGLQLMEAGLERLKGYPRVCLWVLKENRRAIRFYQKCGFVPDGEELISKNIGATEIKMVLKKTDYNETSVENMNLRKIDAAHMQQLWELQKAYKAEIGEDEPGEQECARMASAIQKGLITFFGAWDKEVLIGCCSITVGFSTFDYAPSGVFEDFYIRPEFRHKGIARQLVRYAYQESGISSMTVGCADCDVLMYQALGFSVPLGKLLAFES